MHHSRLCAVLIDCRTSDVDEAARFWSQALGRAIDSNHPGTRGNYRMLERWVVMQAPTGQRFCVVRVQRPGYPKNSNRWD